MKSGVEVVAKTLRIPVTVNEALTEAARLDRRSSNDLIVAIVMTWLEGRMYQPIARASVSGDSAQLAPGEVLFKRPPGRPRKARIGAQIDAYMLTLIEQRLDPAVAYALPDVLHALGVDPAVANNDVYVVNHLLHLRWVPREHPTDARDFWLSPEHPQWSSNG